MDPQLLESIVCPRCQGPLRLELSASTQRPLALICSADQLCYPIESGIPVLLLSRATACSAASLP